MCISDDDLSVREAVRSGNVLTGAPLVNFSEGMPMSSPKSKKTRSWAILVNVLYFLLIVLGFELWLIVYQWICAFWGFCPLEHPGCPRCI